MTLTEPQKGELFILAEVLLWSFFPIVAILSFSIPAILAAGLSTLFAAGFFAVLLTARKKWHEIKDTSAWKYILIATGTIGIAYFGLFFIGLQHTTAGNGAIIELMSVFFTFLILGLWGKEIATPKSLLGAVLMVTGALLVIFPGTFRVNAGDLIILFAVALPPVGNYYMQMARKKVSAKTIMFCRSLLSGIFLVVLSLIMNGTPNVADLKSALPFLALNGIFLLGLSKIFWIEAIHRMQVTKAISLAAAAPAFTLIFAFFILNEVPTIWQLAGLLPIIGGVVLLTTKKQGEMF